jgi:hypothetical protein
MKPTLDTAVADTDKQAQRKRNLRTGLILASVALVFFAGIITKYVLLQR